MLILRSRRPDDLMGPAQFTAPLGPVVPILASMVSLGILAGATSQQLLAGGAALLGGALFYGLATLGRQRRA